MKLYPFHNVWPVYQNYHEWYNDFAYTVWASPTKIQQFTDYFAMIPVEQGQINTQLCISSSQKIIFDCQRQLPPECQERPLRNSFFVNLAPLLRHKYVTRHDPSFREEAIQKVMKFPLSIKLEELVTQELMISVDQAKDIIFEYRRFILMYGTTGRNLYPSEKIEKVWLIHMSCSSNYVQFCNQSIEFVPFHIPLTDNTPGHDSRQDYIDTLSLYEVMFKKPP